MSNQDPPDSQDPDRTILIPAPGGRRPAAPPVQQPEAMAPPEQPAPAPYFNPAPAPAPAPQANLTPPARGKGLNPLVAAANPLLELVMPLRGMATHPNVEQLRQQLVGAVKTFEQQAKAALVPNDAIAVARFSLCTFLDETISSTPWGGGGVWASRSLLVTFHNEASGGEKFFLLLQKLCQDPNTNLDTLELMYLCLALGLEGRYKVVDGGRAQLDILRERLQQLIAQHRGEVEPALSLHWQGAKGKGESLWRVMPIWVVAVCALALVVVLQLVFSWRLGRASDPVFDSLLKIKLNTAPPPVQVAPLQAAPVRVAKFLAPEIAEGLVSVVETADRSTITLRGDGVFASGSAEVASKFMPLLGRIGEALGPVPGKVIVIGHTDSTKGFSAKFPSNWDLSQGRASAVRKILAERAGPATRYSVEGRGDSEPVVPNDTPVNRAKNRRVDIIVLTPAL